VIAGEHAAGAIVPERYRQLAASSEFVCALTSELLHKDKRRQQKAGSVPENDGHSDRRMPKAVQRAKPVTVRQYILAEIASVSPVRTTFQTCGTKLQTEQTEARYPMMSAASMRHAGRFLGLPRHLANVQHHDFEPTLAIQLDMRAENTEPTAATPPGSPGAQFEPVFEFVPGANVRRGKPPEAGLARHLAGNQPAGFGRMAGFAFFGAVIPSSRFIFFNATLRVRRMPSAFSPARVTEGFSECSRRRISRNTPSCCNFFFRKRKA
jgi:hypothetical protein